MITLFYWLRQNVPDIPKQAMLNKSIFYQTMATAQKKQKDQICYNYSLGKFTKDDGLFDIMDDCFIFVGLVRSIALSLFLFCLTELVYRYNLCTKAQAQTRAQGRGLV
jgi:hypothetical protein